MGRIRMAIKLLTQATEMAPDYYGAWSDLARLIWKRTILNHVNQLLNEQLDYSQRWLTII